MPAKEAVARRSRAAAMLENAIEQGDASQIVSSLADGLTTLRKLLYQRVHHDVEEIYGQDSMLVPLSEEKCEHRVKSEIEVYQIAVCSEEAHERRYITRDMVWLAQWLARLRLGENYAGTRYDEQLTAYLELEREKRRQTFVSVLQRTLPETSKAPLVLYRLFPLAVRIVTAVAFGDATTAGRWRRQQTSWLPAIADCHDCHGQILDTSEICPQCGNPVWQYKWLTVAD